MSSDWQQLTEQLSVLTAAGLPLPEGLRAAAAELPNRRVATAMRLMATELESGKSLESIVVDQPYLVPAHVRRLIETGVRSGQLADVLVEFVEIERSSQELWRGVWLAISYPLVLSAGALALLIWISLAVLPQFREVFEDYGITMPIITEFVLGFTFDRVMKTLGFLITLGLMLWILYRVSVSRPVRHRILNAIPFFGPVMKWRAVALWSRLLGLLVKQEIPLPEALRLTAGGVNDANLARESLRMASDVSEGRRLAAAIAMGRSLPFSMIPFVRWGEDSGTLPEACRTVGEMLEERVRMRATLLQIVVPPLTFIFIGSAVMFMIVALFLPLVRLITTLS